MREAREGISFAPYVLVGDGATPAMAVQAVPRCPWAVKGELCLVTRDGRRRRATGPGFPLQVMKCATHSHFTVYPMGWAPYARTAVAPVSIGGDPLRAQAASPLAKWRRTVFEAPVTVSSGTAARRGEGGHADAFQQRHIAKAAEILGLGSDITPATAEQIRGELGLPGLDHDKARRDFAGAQGHLSRARAIVLLLAALVVDAAVCPRILRAGHLAGAWGRPLVLGVAPYGSVPPPGTDPGFSPGEVGRAPHESVADPPGDPPKLPNLASAARQVVTRCTDMSSG